MRPSYIAVSLVAVAVIVVHAPPVRAAALFFAANGSGSTCTQASPCLIIEAISEASTTPPVELACANSDDVATGATVNKTVTIDCSGTSGSIDGITVNSGATVTLKNFTIGGNTDNGIFLISGTLIMENIHFIGAIVNLLNAAPSAPSRLIVRNCIFENGGSAILLKPAAGGSLSAQFDHVIIAGNSGGGIKIDTTNGPVTVDITDSVIRDNGGNGVNAVAGAGAGLNTVSIKNSVIAKNGAAGVQANGANAGILLQTTLLDQNSAGATSTVGGGSLVTYSNNTIVGSAGSGFTATAGMQ
jgi:hypothetical protein